MVVAVDATPMRSPDAVNQRLLKVYRRYLGEPERTSDVFVGFALFFGGILIAAIGLLVFLASFTVVPGGTLFWQLREVAIVFSMTGLPSLLLSIVILLPVSTRAVYASLGGVILCLVATGIFVAAYPQAWNVEGVDYSPYGITVYAGGLTVLVASTGAALVAHHLERARPGEPTDERAPATESGPESISDEEVKRDIEESLSASEFTWGGVESADNRRLELKQQTSDEDFEPTELTASSEVRTNAGVDESVSELRKLQGWQPTAERGTGTDDQAAALKELRERSEDEEESGWLNDIVKRFKRG